jgi:hypothetical protein
MPAKRPAGVTAVAVLSIVFGALALLLGVCGGGLQAVGLANLPPPGAGDEPEIIVHEELQKALPAIDVIQLLDLLVVGGLGLGLVLAGIGLLNMQGWGRVLALLVAAVMAVHAVADLGFNVAVYAPALSDAVAVARKRAQAAPVPPPPGEMEGFEIGTKVGVGLHCAANLAELGFAVALGLVLMSARIRQAFRRRRRRAYDDYFDDEDDFDDRRRRRHREDDED